MSRENQDPYQLKILIVDDEPVNVEILEQMLEDEGYENLRSTTDPRQVLPIYQEEGFDLLLLDIRMPHLSGIELLQLLATPFANDYVPVLVLTAQTDDTTRSEALQAGATDFLTKPFRQWEVLLRIRNMLRTRLYYIGQRQRGDTLEQRVRERTKEVYATQLKVVERLGRAGEFRDNETGAHVIRMSRCCQLLALAAGLDERQAERILYASPMHDVGKIGIRDEILLKPGKLSAEEFHLMKQHVEIGREIIGDHDSNLLQLAGIIAFSHHEKWDGSGYPQGLQGEEIPYEGRIAAICDVFDALTSARPYKDAWPVERAVALIEEESGRHFDPQLTTLFLGLIPQVVALRGEFPDLPVAMSDHDH
ncbi:MAG: response regulator [Gammaproteobacteria bacterium]|nr:response regulator [Gammaproteobacteria bacterium]